MQIPPQTNDIVVLLTTGEPLIGRYEGLAEKTILGAPDMIVLGRPHTVIMVPQGGGKMGIQFMPLGFSLCDAPDKIEIARNNFLHMAKCAPGLAKHFTDTVLLNFSGNTMPIR